MQTNKMQSIEEVLENTFPEAIKTVKPNIYKFLNKPNERSVLSAHRNIEDSRMFVCKSQIGYLVFHTLNDFLTFEIRVPKELKQFHEVIFGNRPQKARWDIDCPSDKLTIQEFDELIKCLINESLNVINTVYYRESYDDGHSENGQFTVDDWIICTSFGPDVLKTKKYSAHLIFNEPMYFFDNHDARGFHDFVLTKIPENYKQFIDAQV